MSEKVSAIDRKKLPRDLASFILTNENKIRSAILTVMMDNDEGEVINLFARITNNDLAFAIQLLQVCFFAEMMGAVEVKE